LECPKCNNDIISPEGINGEQICGSCGLVVNSAPAHSNFIHWAPEWFSNWSEEDSETIKEWLTTLRAVSCQLNLPNYPYREEAARTIRSQNSTLFKSQKLSKNKRTAVAALIHLILREYNKSRPLKEISKELNLNEKSVTKHAWLLNKMLNLKEEKSIKIQRKTAVDYLNQHAAKITNNKQLILNANNTLLKIKKAGGNPIGVAAGAFYNSCKNSKAQISKEKIGEIFKISERTVYVNEARIRKILKKASPNEKPMIPKVATS
jgi:transcription initiation factor TFIIIB Brf1 subunit/transcription initiation factor TFIIB